MKLVYVKHKDGQWLMPCRPATARKLLKNGYAKVIKREPFCIQMKEDTGSEVQDVTVGVDKGSKVTGFCVIGNGEILMSGHINHRQDIKKKMDVRANNRRQRRSRLWYRKPRFNNRASSKRSGRLPPSIKANVEEVYRVLTKLPLPVNEVIIEDVLIDIARLNDAELNGKEYQESNRLDENLRLATLIRDNFTCQHCKAKKVKLHAHHIIWRSNGGKDTISNMLTLCHPCHDKVHEDEIVLNGGVSGFKDRIAQRTMQGKTYLYGLLKERFSKFSKVFGYETSVYRKELGLPKDHDTDALAIATINTGEEISYHRDNFYNIVFRATQTRRQYYDQPKKGKGRVKFQVNKNLDGFMKGDLVLVRNRFIKQINSIYSNGLLAFRRINGEPSASSPQNCRLIERRSSIVFSAT